MCARVCRASTARDRHRDRRQFNPFIGRAVQRLSIARALLRSAPILIFDEATSFLDTETEAVIKATLSDIMGRCTLFVIAHRLSTVEQANHIIVMQKGQIVEQGTHKDLFERKGSYYKLYRYGQNKGLLE